MTARRFSAAVACAWAALAAACDATETGNPIADHSLALTARSSEDTVVLDDAPAPGGLSAFEAWVVLGDIRFVQSADCDSGGGEDADIEGPLTVELIAEPQSFEFAVPEASYCRVRVRLERAEDVAVEQPQELADHAILIRGTRADGTAFALRSRQTREADIRSRDEPFELSQTSGALILAFDVGRWLSGVDVDGAVAGDDDDGVIWIDENRNRDQLDQFEDNVEAAMELFRDDDGDGELDGDEDDDALASGVP